MADWRVLRSTPGAAEEEALVRNCRWMWEEEEEEEEAGFDSESEREAMVKLAMALLFFYICTGESGDKVIDNTYFII